MNKTFAEQQREWLIETTKAIGLDEINPFAGKSYRSIIFEYNLTHPDNPITDNETGTPNWVLRDIRH